MKQMMQAFMVVGAVMVLTGAAVYITGWVLAPYVYTIGATLFALAQINTPARVQNAVVRRLRRQQIFGALVLVLTGAFMLFTHGNEWIVNGLSALPLQPFSNYILPFAFLKKRRRNCKGNKVFWGKLSLTIASYSFFSIVSGGGSHCFLLPKPLLSLP